MGFQKLALSAVSLVMLVGIVMYGRDTCDGCATTAAGAPSTTTTLPTATSAPAGSTAVDVLDIQEALESSSDARSLSALFQEFGSITDVTEPTEEQTDTTEGEAEEDGGDSETTESKSETDAKPDTNADADSDGSASGAASTSTSTTVKPAPAPAAAPAPVNSNVPASGSKIWVNPNGGNDGNDGLSEGQALKSLQTALRRVKAGETVYLMSGQYRELKVPDQLHYFISNSGTASNWIRITNAPGHKPEIVANNGTALLIGGAYIEVSGLRIRGEGFSKTNDWGVGISIADTHHVRVLNSTISGMATSGIGVNRTSNVHLINNVIYETAFWNENNSSGISFIHQTNLGHGPDYGKYHDVVVGNRLFRNENKVPSVHQDYKYITDGNGVIIDSNRETNYKGRTLIANNLSYDNGGRGILTHKSDHIDILFNTSYHNTRTKGLIGEPAEIIASRGTDIKIEHNIAWARPGVAAHRINEVSNFSSKGNIYVTDSPGSKAPVSSTDVIMSGNPGLRNASTNSGSADFRPLVGGALIGKASASGVVPRDLAGTSRSGAIEPGAFEAEAGSGR